MYDEPYSSEKVPRIEPLPAEPFQVPGLEESQCTNAPFQQTVAVPHCATTCGALEDRAREGNLDERDAQNCSTTSGMVSGDGIRHVAYSKDVSAVPLPATVTGDSSTMGPASTHLRTVNQSMSSFQTSMPTRQGLPLSHGSGHRFGPESWGDMEQMRPDFDVLFPMQRGGKRGPFRDPNLREQTAQTRKIGSCIRCRMQRIRCEHNPEDPAGDCMTCKKVANTKIGRFPCLRYKITDVRLHKPGQVPGYEWTRRWNHNISDPIQKWASAETKQIRISDGYSNRFIELRVREFVPQDGDKLERTWDFGGEMKSVMIPPYALEELDDGKMAYTKHIRDAVSDTFTNVLGRQDGLLYKTYFKAVRLLASSSSPLESAELLNWTFKLWMSIRLSTRSNSIVGSETLGMDAGILDKTHPNHGMIPLPPVLGAQLDLILIHHIQSKLRRELLDKLQKTILKNKPGTWFVTYLVTFILLHNAAMIVAHDASYAFKHGMKRRFAREDKVEEYHLGANILLAHFHYCSKGVHPFSDKCKDQDLRTLADLDEQQIQFVHETRSYARRHKQEWDHLRERHEYENDYYFVSQLFEEDWKPRPM